MKVTVDYAEDEGITEIVQEHLERGTSVQSMLKDALILYIQIRRVIKQNPKAMICWIEHDSRSKSYVNKIEGVSGVAL